MSPRCGRVRSSAENPSPLAITPSPPIPSPIPTHLSFQSIAHLQAVYSWLRHVAGLRKCKVFGREVFSDDISDSSGHWGRGIALLLAFDRQGLVWFVLWFQNTLFNLLQHNKNTLQFLLNTQHCRALIHLLEHKTLWIAQLVGSPASVVSPVLEHFPQFPVTNSESTLFNLLEHTELLICWYTEMNTLSNLLQHAEHLSSIGSNTHKYSLQFAETQKKTLFTSLETHRTTLFNLLQHTEHLKQFLVINLEKHSHHIPGTHRPLSSICQTMREATWSHDACHHFP